MEDIKEMIMQLAYSRRSGGFNPGALNVAMQLHDVFGAAPIIALNMAGIQGEEVWLLYKDICNEDVNALGDMLQQGTAMTHLKQCPYSSFYQAANS